MANKILVSGEKVKINDYASAQRYEIQIQIDSSMIIDICCFGLDANKQLSDDRYMVFYNQSSSPEAAISLTVSEPRRTVFLIHLNKLPREIKNLVFTAAIDGNGTMSAISKGYLELIADGKEIVKFNFSGQDFHNEKAIIISEIYFKEVWRLGAVGQGFNGGLSALLKYFGGEEIVEFSNNTESNSGFKYYYSKLDSAMKKAYDAMLVGINNYSDSIHINQNSTIHESSISDLVQYVTLDNPELFYLASNYEYRVVGNKIFYKPNYLFDKQTIQQKKARLLSVADGILKQLIHHTMDDYAKELALHDYLVKQVVYDYDSLSMQNPPNDIYSAYGALINNKAVCSGYAHAMKLLLDKCGIDCLIVTGDSTIPDSQSSVGHAWNIVKIKQQFYHLDVTWDAPINKSPDELFHYYFNVTDKAILIDHTWIFDTPKCTADEYNYFTVQGLNISDDTVFKEKLKQTIRHKNSMFIFKYTASSSVMNSDKLNVMIGDVWESGLFASGSLSWTVSYNDRQKVFNVAFNYG